MQKLIAKPKRTRKPVHWRCNPLECCSLAMCLLLSISAVNLHAQNANDWPAYGGALGGGHFSDAQDITPTNVASLKEIWRHQSGDMHKRDIKNGVLTQSAFQATPIMVDGLLYYCTGSNKVFALDAATGAERWQYDPEVAATAEFLPVCRGVSYWNSGAAGACEQRIIMGTLDSRLIALDALSGKPCQDFGKGGAVSVTSGLADHLAFEYSITSPPAIVGDLIVTGAMVIDNYRKDVPSGVVRAYSVRSGQLIWAWNPVPAGMRALEPNGDYRNGTTNVWSILSVDEDRGLVFVPTGNTSPDYFGGLRAGLDKFSSSVVALNAADGSVAWYYQFVHHDIWDYDTPAQPTLVDLNLDGKTIPALVQVTKMGFTFVLNRVTGQPVWPVEERPVPQNPVPGEYLSPTQPFPTHVPHLIDPRPLSQNEMWGLTPIDRFSCQRQLGKLRNEGIFTPPSTEGSVFFPGNGGGNNWGSPAIDPTTGIMTVVTMRNPSKVTLTPAQDCSETMAARSGLPYCAKPDWMTSFLGVPCTAPPWGTLDTIDLVQGELLWSVPLGTTAQLAPFPFRSIRGVPAFGGPTLTAAGVIFIGAAMEHKFRAFDAASGEELWATKIPAAAHATPMTYKLEPSGKQIVVVAAGGHWSGLTRPGDALIAYALPDDPR